MSAVRLSATALPAFGARAARNLLGAFEDLAQRGDVIRVGLGPRAVWLLNRPELARYVLEQSADGFEKGGGAPRVFLGDSLLTLEGDEHRRRRRTVLPALGTGSGDEEGDRVVRELAAPIPGLVDRATRGWAAGMTIDAQAEMVRLNRAIAVAVIFGLDPVSARGRALDEALERTAFSVPIGPTARLPLPRNRRFNRSLDALDALIVELIAEARREPSSAGGVLGHLAALPADAISDRAIRDELVTMFSGHKSSGQALAWALYLLAENPGAEEGLRAEASRLDGRLPEVTDLPGFTWTRAVVAEAMRLYPPIWILPRRAIREHRIGEIGLRRGDTVLVSQYLIQRDERLWPEAGRFDPGRWENGAPSQPFAYFPFGGGPRSCAGERLAWDEMVLALATIGRAGRVRRVSGAAVQPVGRVSLRARGGIPLALDPA